MSDDPADPLPVIGGERVELRPATDDDVTDLARIRRHPDVFEHWRGGDDLEAAVREDLAEEDSHGYVIVADDRIIGWIQWQEETEPDHRQASMDVYVDADLRGRGLGTEAVRTMARYLVDDRRHHRLTIDPAAHNTAAVRSYTKVGFRPIGIGRRAERGPDGTWHDALLMDLLADELER